MYCGIYLYKSISTLYLLKQNHSDILLNKCYVGEKENTALCFVSVKLFTAYLAFCAKKNYNADYCLKTIHIPCIV